MNPLIDLFNRNPGAGVAMGKGIYHKITSKKHTLKCTTCGKFISTDEAVWYTPIPNMIRHPYHVKCDKP